MLAEPRRAPRDPPRRLLETIGRAGVAHGAPEIGVPDRGREAARRDVAILERLLRRLEHADQVACPLTTDEEVVGGEPAGREVQRLASGGEDRRDLVVDADLRQVDEVALRAHLEKDRLRELFGETELVEPGEQPGALLR